MSATIFRDIGHRPKFTDILDHHIQTPVTDALEDYLTETDKLDSRIVCFFDYPGVGKTATCYHAAKNTNSLYIRFRLDGDLAVNTSELIKEYYTQKEGGVFKFSRTPDQIVNVVASICTAMMNTLLRNAHTIASRDDKPQNEILVSSNGVLVGLRYENFDTSAFNNNIDKKIEILLKYTGKSTILLHVDECQAWSSVATFSKSQDEEEGRIFTNYESHLDNYRLLGLCNCLKRLMDRQKCVTVVMSGTNKDVQKQIVIDSSLKLLSVPMIMYSTVKTIQTVVDHYCDFSLLDTEELRKIFMDLCGPMRLIQLFLLLLYRTASKIPKENVTLKMVNDIVRQVYSEFSTIILSGRHQESQMFICNLMSIVWKHPEFASGTIGLLNSSTKLFTCDVSWYDDGEKANSTYKELEEDEKFIEVVQYPIDNIPSEWMAFEDTSVVRWIRQGVFTYMLAPFPFLREKWESMKPHYFTEEEKNRLRGYMSNITSKGAHGDSFQLVVCLELTVTNCMQLTLFTFLQRPDSPLFDKLTLGHAYSPATQYYKRMQFYSKNLLL
jgi:hypothetical protein